jgi:hypothetical protein
MRKALYATAAIVRHGLGVSGMALEQRSPDRAGSSVPIAAADIEFKERLKSQFSVGMAESDLVRDLQAQGFRPPVSYRGAKYATFSMTSIPCELTWSVGWRADPEGKITDIDGSYSATCP